MYLLRIFTLLCLLYSVQSLAKNTDKPRIIALAPHVVEMLYEVGAGEQIIATVDYSDYPKQALDIPRIGGYYGVQIEKILALEPDLVIAWQGGNIAADIERIKSLGIPMLFSEPHTFADVANEIRLFAKASGHEERGEQVAAEFERALDAIRKEQLEKDKLKVFYQLWSEPMMTVNKNTWINQLVETCQGENVFADNPTEYPQISIENVVVAQPEVIIIPDEKSDTPQPEVNWQAWPSIPAVKANRFVNANADVLHRYSSRVLIGLTKLCQDLDNYRTAVK